MAENFSEYNRLVTLRQGLTATDAQLLKSILTANGIEVFMSGVNASSLEPGIYSDVMIRSIDRVRADSVLEKVATMPRCQIPRHLDEDGSEQFCISCGSGFVHPYVGAVDTWIPGVKKEVLAGDGWYHCRQCGTHFCTQRSRFSGMPFGMLWAATVGVFVFALYWFIGWLRWL